MLGIDIGSYSIKAATVKKSGKKAIIEQIACEVLPTAMRGGSIDSNSLQNMVTKLIKTVGKGQKTVALSIPTSAAILKTLSVDNSLSGDLLEGEVQLELVNFVPFPLDQVYSDFISLGKSKQNPEKQDVFVAASRRDIVDKVAGSVAVKSISNKVVDIEVFAIGQIIELLHGKNYNGTYGVIDIGYRSSTICVFSNGEMIFSREQQVGGHHLTETIAEANGIGIEEAEQLKHTNINSVSASILSTYLDSVSEQIALAFEFFGSTNDVDIESIYLTGGGSNISGLIDNISENIPDKKFEQLPIGSTIKVSKKTNGMELDYAESSSAVVAGLAMRK